MLSASTPEILTFWLNAELLSRLSASKTRYLIVGGTAVNFYCKDRKADDLDILIEPTLENARRVIAAIEASHVVRCDFTAAQLAQPSQHIEFKISYYLDILTPKPEFQFSNLMASACDAHIRYQGSNIPLKVASKETLIELLTGSKEAKHATDIALLRGS